MIRLEVPQLGWCPELLKETVGFQPKVKTWLCCLGLFGSDWIKWATEWVSAAMALLPHASDSPPVSPSWTQQPHFMIIEVGTKMQSWRCSGCGIMDDYFSFHFLIISCSGAIWFCNGKITFTVLEGKIKTERTEMCRNCSIRIACVLEFLLWLDELRTN